MVTPVKDKKRFSLFALLGLFVIFSMLITSVVEVRALSDGQITQTIAIASPEFTDSVGDGLEDVSAPTPTPTDIMDDGEDGELTAAPTDEAILEVTEEPDLEETPTPDVVEGTPTLEETEEADLEETQTPEPLMILDIRMVEPMDETRKGGGNPGSIKTTKNSDCTGAVNANHYIAGETVYIRGENFNPGSYDWNIKGQPGNASEDPNQVVASGTYTVGQSGSFCLAAYTINEDDGGEYKATFGKKHDNYRVDRTVAASLQISESCTWDGTESLVDVTFSNLVGVASITWDGVEDSDLSAGFWIIENQSAGAHTYSWKAQKGFVGGGKNISINLEGCAVEEPDYQDLGLSYICLDNGSHHWTVTNPNNLTISYNWESTVDSQSGSSSVGENSTDTFDTNASLQTVTISFYLPLEKNAAKTRIVEIPPRTVSVEADACKVALDLTIDVACLPNGDHQWTVNNPNPDAITFNWVSDNGIDSGSGLSVAANSTTNFISNAQAQTVTVTYDYLAVTGRQILGTSEESCWVPQSLSLTETCLRSGNHQWTVTNPNPVAISFIWFTDETPPLQSGGPLTVPANAAGVDGSIAFESDHTLQIINIKYDYPEAILTGVIISLAAEKVCTLPQLPLQIEPVCSFPTDPMRTWMVTNPNDFDVNYSIQKNGNQYWKEFNKIAPPGVSYLQTSLPIWKIELIENGKLGDYATSSEPCFADLSLNYDCKPDGAHAWTISNSNSIDIEFQWSQNLGSFSEWMTLAAGSTYNFTIANANSQTVSVNHRVNLGSGVYLRGSNTRLALFCLVLDPPDVSGQCTIKDGVMQHKWTIENPNNFFIGYSWSSTSGQSNSTIEWLWPDGTCHNCDTDTFYTDHTAQTLTIYYQKPHGSIYSFNVEADNCIQAPALTASCGYDNDVYGHIWTISNTNPVPLGYTWTGTNTDPASGSGTVGANSSTEFFTNENGSLQSVSLTYTYQNESITLDLADAEACLLEPLVLYSCREFDNSHIWTIENPNTFTISVRTKLDDGDYADWLAIAAGANASLDPTSSTIQTMTVQYRYADETIHTMEPIAAEECKLSGLTLSFLCGYPSDDALFWNVTNPFDFDVDFVVVVDGGAAAAKQTVPANGEIIIQTALGSQTAVIYVNGNEVARADSGETCLLDLELDYQCLENGKHQWTVTNSNKEDILINWYLNGSLSGSDIGVKAGESATFTTANGTHTVRIEHIDEIFGPKVVEMEAEACKITVITPELPTYVTPNVVSGTCQPWIVFHTYRDGNMEIYRLDGIEGVGSFQLYNLSKGSSYDSHPSRSFDDAWVAFQSYRDGNNEIYYTDSSGNKQVRLTNNAAQDINPMFSPDNVNIIFQSNRNGSWDLYLVNRLTGEEIQLTDHSADEVHPFFSMDKIWLVFESNRNGNWDIFRLNLATGEEIQVTDGSENETHPAWSPNGQKIAYLAPVDGVSQLFVIGIDGSNKTQITSGDGDTSNHSWSPDSTRLAYQSERDGNVDIYAYDLRDNTEYRVTDGAEKDISPTWDCGGVNLAFSSKGDGNSMDIYMSFWKGGGSSYMTNHPAVDQWSLWSPAIELGSRGK